MDQQGNTPGKKRPHYHHYRPRKPAGEDNRENNREKNKATDRGNERETQRRPAQAENQSAANGSRSRSDNPSPDNDQRSVGKNRGRQNRERTLAKGQQNREIPPENESVKERGRTNRPAEKRESPVPVASTPLFTEQSSAQRSASLSDKNLSTPLAEDHILNEPLDFSDIIPPISPNYLFKTPESSQGTAPQEVTASETTSENRVEIVGVRFSKTGKVYYFAPGPLQLKKGDYAIVDTARGMEYGEVHLANTLVPEGEIVPPLRSVVRAATPQDAAHHADNKRKEQEAFLICLEKIKIHKLDMKLVEAQYTFDNSKLLFYFTSAGRVDFRELVKDLASVFRTRIELRQIGIRDEAKLMGGLGICGRSLCCTTFLADFAQVSIKMAKEQNLSLNSNKISGTCGRLMCCLHYEYGVYCEESKKIPAPGSFVATPDGNGTVVEVNVLAGQAKVALVGAAPGTIPKFYRREQLKLLSEPRRGEESEHDSAKDRNIRAENDDSDLIN